MGRLLIRASANSQWTGAKNDHDQEEGGLCGSKCAIPIVTHSAAEHGVFHVAY